MAALSLSQPQWSTIEEEFGGEPEKVPTRGEDDEVEMREEAVVCVGQSAEDGEQDPIVDMMQVVVRRSRTTGKLLYQVIGQN